jgi:hypothetical protein
MGPVTCPVVWDVVGHRRHRRRVPPGGAAHVGVLINAISELMHHSPSRLPW